MEGTGSTILAVEGWKATYLFSRWHLSWLASQSIYYISIIQASGVQLTCNNMEFNEVLGFLFIFQKILYLEKQRNRDLFQCRLHLKKKSWWMLFWSLLLLHSEITCFTLKWDDGVWTKWRPLWVSVQLTLYPYIPAWAVGASRIVLMSGEGADYLHISLYFFFFSLKPFFLSPLCKRWPAGLPVDNSELSSTPVSTKRKDFEHSCVRQSKTYLQCDTVLP